MWKSQPGKWVLWAPLTVGPPLLASLLITTPQFVQQVDATAKANLAKVDSSWARVEFDGRDAMLFGDAASDSILSTAVDALQASPGVRLVENRARVVPPPPVVTAPVISSVKAEQGTVTVTGTWDNAHATTLAVKLGDKSYVMPGSRELTTSGANWTLSVADVLPAGTYPVTVEASDGTNPPVAAAASQSVVIAPPPPPPPPPPPAPVALPTMVLPPAGAAWPYALSGTWPEGEARKLAVSLAGKTWDLGSTAGLQSDGAGHWSLMPDVALTPGTYDVKVLVKNADGTEKATEFPNIIKVEEPAAPPAPAPAPAPAAVVEPVTAPVLVGPALISSAPVKLAGTWSESPDKSLQVTVADTSYVLRKNPELTSDGKGAWALALPDNFADGPLKIVAQTLDASGAPVGPAAESVVELNIEPPAAPTVGKTESDQPVTELHGTWPEGDATQLSVSVANTPMSAVLGDADGALTSDGKGNWTYRLPQPLATGSYDIIVRATDKAGHTSSDLGAAEVTVKQAAVAPAAPAAPEPQAAAPVVQEQSPAVVAEVPAAEPAQPAAEPAQPAAEPAQPAAEPAQPVAEPAQPATTAAVATSLSCDDELQKLEQQSPLRFDFNHDGLPLATQPALRSYAQALMSESCTGLSFTVTGNADRWGSEVYNQQLSEARAKVIARELSALGIPADRMRVAGNSETQPIDAQDNLDAWKRNRRVDIRVAK